MLSLQSQHHSDRIAEALQSKTSLNILVAGCTLTNGSTVSRQIRPMRAQLSERLWILSPLVRETLGSLAGLVRALDPLIILPDFTQEDIEMALKMLQGHGKDNLIINSVTKNILETLGMNLNISAPISMKTPYVRLKKVKVANLRDPFSSDKTKH